MRDFFGESLYRLYRVILKLVLTIVPTVLVAITCFTQLAQFEFTVEGILPQIISLCIHMTVSLIHAIIVSFIWVTVVFFLLKICSFPIDKVDIDSLERLVSKKESRDIIFSKNECIFNILGILFVLWLVCFQPQWIASYQVVDGQLQVIEPLFNEQVLRDYHPIIFIIYGYGILYYMCKLMIGKLSIKLLLLQLIYHVSACFLFCFIMLNQSVFNERFFTTLFAFSHLNWTPDWYICSRILIAISIVSLVIDMSKSFIEYNRNH